MDKQEFFKFLMEDEDAGKLLNVIREMVEGYGENGDDFLNYVVGSVSSYYKSLESFVTNVEGLKLLMLMKSMGFTSEFVAKARREREPFKVKPA